MNFVFQKYVSDFIHSFYFTIRSASGTATSCKHILCNGNIICIPVTVTTTPRHTRHASLMCVRAIPCSLFHHTPSYNNCYELISPWEGQLNRACSPRPPPSSSSGAVHPERPSIGRLPCSPRRFPCNSSANRMVGQPDASQLWWHRKSLSPAVTSPHAMPCYAMSCYVVLCYVIICYYIKLSN